MIEESLVTVLLAASGVTDLIAARLYPLRLPQMLPDQPPELPAVTYQRIAGPREHAMSEASCLAYPVFQLSCWATTYAGAKALAAALKAALDGKSVGAGGMATLQNDPDLIDPETGWYYVAADYQISHQE